MNFCLSDLVPPLRWSDASTITLLTGQPDLPDAWWRSLPMPRVLAAIGPESLGELLTEIALEHWPAASIGDVLPALHVLDPDEADEPAVAIALDRTGSWAGLLALTSRELVDQPFIQARPVLNTLFSAVLVHLAQPLAYAAPAQGGKQETPPAAQPPLAHEPFAHEQDVREQAAREAEPAAAAPEGEHEAEEARSAPAAAENVAEDAAGTGDAARHDAEVAAAQHAAEVTAAEQAEEAAAPEAEPESAPESAQVVVAHHEDALEPHHGDASEAHHGDALAVHHGDALDTAD
ncbi:hypothetical protein AB0J43_50360, partial [Nonomuraea fuscirosea]